MTQYHKHMQGSVSLKTVFITAVISVSVFAAAAWFSGYLTVSPMINSSHLHEKEDTAESDTLYTCGMHPMVISDEPGYCPLCEMALTPIRKDDESDSNNGERQIAYWREPGPCRFQCRYTMDR
jgi:hypothetical protein